MYNLNENIELNQGELDVVAVGEVLVDMISESYEDDNSVFYRKFGGSPGNLSINLSMLGFESAVIANVGEDSLGKFIKGNLIKNEVNIKGLSIDKENNTSIVVLNKSLSNPKFLAYRQADKNIQLTEDRIDILGKSKILHFTSWTISHNPSRNTIMELINIARRKNIIISFDPNYRKVLWDKNHDGLKFIEEILENVDIIKPSLDDAYNMFGQATNKEYIDGFLKFGVKLVILTLGKDGLVVSNGRETIELPTLAEKVVDTTGAGDAFWSGFYSGLLRGETIRKSVDIGSAVSAYKLQSIGGLSELPSIDDIRKIYNI